MNVRDHRQRRAAHYLAQRLGVGKSRYGTADDIAAGRRELLDLDERGLYVGGSRNGHRLDDDRSAASDLDAADGDLTRAAHTIDSRDALSCHGAASGQPTRRAGSCPSKSS